MRAFAGFLPFALAAVGLAGQEEVSRKTRPLTTRDAVLRIPDVGRTFRVLGDLDGDERVEIAVERLSFDARWRVDAVSLTNGKTLRSLWTANDVLVEVTDWDAGGDLDGDGTGDLLVGMGSGLGASRDLGQVIGVSSRSGKVLHECSGERSFDGFGTSVAFLGDLDADGRDDFAVGAPQVDPNVEVPDEDLHDRSRRLGFVSARSGKDGSQLWRISGSRRGHAFAVEVRPAGDWNGDSCIDLLVRCDPRSREPAMILSGSDGAILDRIDHLAGSLDPIGDIDADGRPDLVVQ